MSTRALPPVSALGMASLGFVVAGGVYLAANLPHHVSLAPAVVLLVLGASTLVANLVWLSSTRDFAWWRFFQVGKWATLAYVITAGMIEYVFVLDHTRGSVLAVLTLMLVTFALDVPLIMSFTVARYATEEVRDSTH